MQKILGHLRELSNSQKFGLLLANQRTHPAVSNKISTVELRRVRARKNTSYQSEANQKNATGWKSYANPMPSSQDSHHERQRVALHSNPDTTLIPGQPNYRMSKSTVL